MLTPMEQSLSLGVFALALSVLTGCSSAVSRENPGDISGWMEVLDGPGASVAVIRVFEMAYIESHGVKNVQAGEPVTERTLF